MFTLTIFGFGPENGSTKGTLGMKFEPERLAFGGARSINLNFRSSSCCDVTLVQPITKRLLLSKSEIGLHSLILHQTAQLII